MDLEYFKDHIFEELEDAKDYIKRAIEIKPMDATWSKTFVDMSANELMHATHLYNMFSQYVNDILAKAYPTMPTYASKIRDEVTEKYTECSAVVKSMHEMYK